MAEQTLAAAEVHAARSGAARRPLFIHLREDHLQDGLRAELHDGTALSGETLLRIACDSGIPYFEMWLDLCARCHGMWLEGRRRCACDRGSASGCRRH